MNQGTSGHFLSINSSLFTYLYQYLQHLPCTQHSLCGYIMDKTHSFPPKKPPYSKQSASTFISNKQVIELYAKGKDFSAPFSFINLGICLEVLSIC